MRLIATIQTLGYLAKIRPMYLVKHVTLLQPYLATKCEVGVLRARTHARAHDVVVIVTRGNHVSHTRTCVCYADKGFS